MIKFIKSLFKPTKRVYTPTELKILEIARTISTEPEKWTYSYLEGDHRYTREGVLLVYYALDKKYNYLYVGCGGEYSKSNLGEEFYPIHTQFMSWNETRKAKSLADKLAKIYWVGYNEL